MFEKASRMKLRFNTQRGVLSVEDLWDLPLIQLDNIAIALNKKLQESKTESFIKTRTKDTTELELKFNIAKHIIDVKLQEQEDRLLESEKKAKRQKILDLMAKKQDAELEGKSLEELAKELDEPNGLVGVTGLLFDADKLKRSINAALSMRAEANVVTRRYGLRQQVLYLMYYGEE